MKKNLLSIFISLVGVTLPVSGAITINVTASALRDSGGSEIVPSFVWGLVADVGADGFDAPSGGDFLGGTDDDIVFGGWQLSTNANRPNSLPGEAEASLGGTVGSGTELRLVWFPTISSLATTPSNGDSFGTFRTSNLGDLTGSDIAFIAPVDGSTSGLLVLDTGSGGTVTTGALSGGGSVIPEPSSSLLAGLGCMVFFLRRRKIKTVTL